MILVTVIVCLLFIFQFIANILLNRAITRIEKDVNNIKRRLSIYEDCLSALMDEGIE